MLLSDFFFLRLSRLIQDWPLAMTCNSNGMPGMRCESISSRVILLGN